MAITIIRWETLVDGGQSMPLLWPSSLTSCLVVVPVLLSSGAQSDVSSTLPCPTRNQRGRAFPIRHPPSGLASAILNIFFD